MNTSRVRTLAPGFTNLRDQPRGRETLHEGQDADLRTNRREHGTFARIQGFGPVVAAFDVDVGLDGSEKAMSAPFGKNDHGIDAGQGGEHLGTLLFRDERTT